MADSPPRSATAGLREPAPDKSKGKSKPPPLSAGQLQDKIAEQVTFAGMVLGSGDPVGGFILLANADNFGQSWAEVARVNPRVKLILERWFSTSVYANAATATAAIALPLLTHYRIMPLAWFNPARESVPAMEELVASGTTLAELLKMHKEAEEARSAMSSRMREATEAMNGNGDETVSDPDHYEAPTA